MRYHHSIPARAEDLARRGAGINKGIVENNDRFVPDAEPAFEPELSSFISIKTDEMYVQQSGFITMFKQHWRNC